MIVPCSVLVNVQATLSPGSSPIVAVGMVVVVLPPPPAQARVDRLQFAGTFTSDTVYVPGRRSVYWRWLDRPGSESSSSRKLVPGSRFELESNSKFWASFGWASFTIVIEPSCVLVNVHTTASPASSPIVAVAVTSDDVVSAPPPKHSMPVRTQPAGMPTSCTV